jgi:hypothetical protein
MARMTGGRFDFATVEYATAPRLAIHGAGANSVALSWPSYFGSFHLQQNTNLAVTNWTSVGAPSDDGTNKTVIINPATGNTFYRLVYP